MALRSIYTQVAASRAVTKVFGKPPDLTREGGSIPVANWLADATGMNVLLLPTSASNDGAHAQNEKWDKEAPVNAVKILGTYLHEISKLVGPRPALCKCAPACVEIKILRRVRAGSPRRPPRHRRGACSMAWRCQFITTRRSQHGRAIAEK